MINILRLVDQRKRKRAIEFDHEKVKKRVSLSKCL